MNLSGRAIARLSAVLFLFGLVWAGYTQDKPQKLTAQSVKKDLYEIAGDGSERDAGNVAI